jgi:replicative DNA helicase
MANNMSKLGYNVAFFSLEMSNKQLITRLIGLESELPYSKLKNMNLDARETELFFLGVDKISRSNIIMNDNTLLTPNTLRSEVKKISRQKKLDAVFVDYVQLMGHDKSTGTREREIAEISRTMKLIAKENNVVVITAAQLNRSVENREDKKPKLSDLRESGALEQDADVVIFLHREDYYDYDKRNEPQVTDIIVAKARNGATGYCQLMFVPEKIKFYEIVAEGLDD